VLCLDNTGSIGYLNGEQDTARPPTNWKMIINFAQSIVRQVKVSPIDTQVGLVDFGGKARIRFGLNTYSTQGEVLDNIAKVPYIGDTTNTTGGLYKSRLVFTDPQYGARDGVSKVLLLITDGNPNVAVETVYEEAQNVRDAGIRTIVVGITESANEDIMRRLAYTPEDYVFAKSFSDLEGISKKVLDDDSCKPVTTPTTPQPPTTITTLTPEFITRPTPSPTTTIDFTTTQPLPVC
jgi:hypothetical protein